jgi:hypothetical protein
MSDLDPDEAIAMRLEANQLAYDRQHQEDQELIERQHRENRAAYQAQWKAEEDAANRRHEEHMARLDRIASALERLADGRA